MPKKIDLIGKIFGRLTVLSQADNVQTPNGRSHVAWNCKCSCGKEVVVRGDMLRNGSTTSCGCWKKEVMTSAGHKRISKLEGKKFGRLTVIKDSGKRDNKGGVIWECSCNCGNTSYVSTSNLTRPINSTISCGCAKSQGETKLISLFINNQIAFVSQKTFEDCISPETNRHLYFDFYLPKYNILIEYDGIQHFKPVKDDRFNYKQIVKRDMYKNLWCKDHNITLIRIPYTDFDIIDISYLKK